MKPGDFKVKNKPKTGAFRSSCNLLAAIFSRPAKFEREWRRLEAVPQFTTGIEGRWQGEWLSKHNGHHGQLRCILSAQGNGEYNARFHATYARILRVSYRVALHGHKSAQGVDLNGETDLGFLAGGIYHYEGVATPTALECAYKCKYDTGNFSLRR